MGPLGFLFSRTGKLPPGVFAIAIALVYLASFVSQSLLAVPVTARAGLWPFGLLQGMLVWVWLTLHIKRMRDAGRPYGMAIGIACLYALALVLLLLIMSMIIATGTSNDMAKTGQGLLHFIMALWFIGLLLGHGDLGMFGYWLLGFLILLASPLFIGIGYSIWAATRPPAAPP